MAKPTRSDCPLRAIPPPRRRAISRPAWGTQRLPGGRIGWAVGLVVVLGWVAGSGWGGSALAQTGGLLRPPGQSEAAVASLPKVKALVLDQVRREPQGRGEKRRTVEVRQLLIVDMKGERLYMADYGRDERGREFLKQHVVLRLDREEPVIWTIAPDGSRYRQHADDLNDLQRERRIAEQGEIQLASRLTARERDKWFEKNCHLRPDGSREVKLTRTPGDKVLERTCEHLVVKENCLTIVDAQISCDVPGARSYFHLYRRLGVFSEEVLDRLRDVDGVPLKAKITVVTALPKYTVEAEVRDMMVREVPEAFFELPPGAVEIVDDEVPRDCPMCGKEVDPDRAVKYGLGDGRILYFDRDRCAQEFARKQRESDGGTEPRRPGVAPRRPPKKE